MKYPDRVGNVFETDLSAIDELLVQSAFHLVVNDCGEADTTGLSR